MGYSPLDDITRENVGALRLTWSRALIPGPQQGTPLAHGGVLYMAQADDVVQAIDAVTGDLIWEYRRDLPDDLIEYTSGDARKTRNIAIYGQLIIKTSGDNYVLALDAATGKLEWETRILDYRVNPAAHSSGPIIANGKVISGRSCRPAGGPDACIMTAHNARTGEELWRRRTIPAPGEPGDETWGGVPFEDRKHVGTWMVPSYDPELNLIYIGTSVTSPAPKFMLGGVDQTHLYHNCTLALDADTGEIGWYYQHLNDHWDLDHPFERLLVDTVVAPNPEAVSWISPRLEPGEVRKVMTGIPGKTGIVYTLDRETGEFLWATPTITQNVISGIDGTTGAVTVNTEVVFTSLGQEVFACPTWAGGKDWEAGAYSPLTNTMYFPLRNTCARMLSTNNVDGERELALTAGGQRGLDFYALAARHQLAPGTDQLGTVRAISAETGETSWLYEQRAATMSLVATGGGLIFGGDVNGRFRAFDHETGEVLWEINLGSPVAGYPISYAVNGQQYIAVSTGTGGRVNLRMTPELRPSFGNNLIRLRATRSLGSGGRRATRDRLRGFDARSSSPRVRRPSTPRSQAPKTGQTVVFAAIDVRTTAAHPDRLPHSRAGGRPACGTPNRLLDGRADEDVVDAVVSFVASELVHRVLVQLHRHFVGPRRGPGTRVVDRDLIGQDARRHARKPFRQQQLVARRATQEARFAKEPPGLDDERIALPASAGMAGILRQVPVRTSVQRNDPRVVDHFSENDHGVLVLEHLEVVVVPARGHRRACVEADDASDL